MKIIVVTWAHNAEKTITRTIQSILSQSYSNFTYYLIDNASTDHTKQIIHQFAASDNRIIPIDNKQNDRWVSFHYIPKILKNCEEGDYLCNIDADDRYKSDFLKKMLDFVQANQLDIAACGNDFIDANTGNLLGVRKEASNLIIEQANFDRCFPQYYQYMRTVWGKLFSASILLQGNFVPDDQMSFYGIDTLFSMEAFRQAKRIGILAESLHQYYMSPQSVSYHFDTKRFRSDQVLFDRANQYLNSKCGHVSTQNTCFLLLVYLNAINDTIKVLLNSKTSSAKKLDFLHKISTDQRTKKLVQCTFSQVTAQRQPLFNQISNWIYRQQIIRSQTGMELAADILASIGVYPTEIAGWKCSSLFLLATKIKMHSEKGVPSKKAESAICSIVSNIPFLSGLSADFLCYFRNIVFRILQQDAKGALKQIETMIDQDQDIPDKYVDDFLQLGLNLSAKLKRKADFIYFKKARIATLISCSRMNDAEKELEDWDKILPGDGDFQMFRKYLYNYGTAE